MLESEARGAADRALAECREALGAPSRAAMWWAGLTRGEQRLLIIGGGLTAALIGASWDEIDGADQAHIIAVARRASAWATHLLEDLP